MKKLASIITILALCLFIMPVSAFANNKFGIHISGPQDLNNAQELVNSNGGDWGYVTAVIPENDKNADKWQDFFNSCREKHLIPIIRIATEPVGDIWKKPTPESLNSWVDFLDNLNWPIKNRYVVIFNEPNHTKEWGGKINPAEYAKILEKAIQVFKTKNQDFFILNAGLDQAAPNSPTTMEEQKFLTQMNMEIPGIFQNLDGWVSHSYPNHGFIGKPWETGKASVKGYVWELSLLKKNFNVQKELSVFITETGWPHSLGLTIKNKYGRLIPVAEKFYKPEITAQYLEQAFNNIWLKDEKVLAVTPFILNYPAIPFDNFSWMDKTGNYYPQFDKIKDMPKLTGKPDQIEKIEITANVYPSFIPANNSFKGKITLKNTGQSIWGEKEFILKSETTLSAHSDIQLPAGILVKPGETYSFEFEFLTPSKGGTYQISWYGLPKYKVIVFDAWTLTNKKDTFFNKLINKILSIWYN